MNTTDLVQFLLADTPPRQAAARPALAPSRYELAAPVRSSILRGRSELVDAQRVDGSWAACSGRDAASLSLLVLRDAYLKHGPSEFAEFAATAILHEQTSTGGWSLRRGSAFDLDTSVLAYFALKLAGESACRPELVRARQAIRANGGADGCSATARLWFALLGQIDYEICPPIAPEWLLMPGCTDSLSATDICLLAARSVVWATRPTREVALPRGIRELFIEAPQCWRPPAGRDQQPPIPSFAGFWKGCERIGWMPLRRRALERADFLLTEATVESATDDLRCDELVWRRIAFDALGHDNDSGVVIACQRLLDQFALGEPDDARSRPHTNLTSDTTLAIEALRASGMGADDDSIAAAIDWLLAYRLNPAHPTKHIGEIASLVQVCGCLDDFGETNGGTLPPDIKLAGTKRHLRECLDRRPCIELEQCSENLRGKAISWQRSDGGWALADNQSRSSRNHGVLRAAVRRSTGVSDAASTGMMLTFITRLPRASDLAPIARAVAFLRSSQCGDGSWACGDGTSSIAATAWAVRGLIAAGSEPRDTAVAAGVNWLLVQQQTSGSWREHVEQPTAKRFVGVEPAIVETAAAVLALVEADLADDEATRRGIEVLVNCDATDGSDLHTTAWILIALSQWHLAIAKLGDRNEPASLHLVCDDLTP